VNSRDPQSTQSVPKAQSENSEPAPPSSHWPSLLALWVQKRPPTMQSSVHSVTGGFSTQAQPQSESERLEPEPGHPELPQQTEAHIFRKPRALPFVLS